MAYLTESPVRDKVKNIPPEHYNLHLAIHSAISALKDSFDIFLSHAMRDAGIILGIKQILESSGKTVYIDWLDDPDLNRESVSGKTAEKLRVRMRQCGSLFYVYSQSSQRSRWMPWELGYFDGVSGNVAILPIFPDGGTLEFENEEYLQIYPKVDFTSISHKPAIFVNRSKSAGYGDFKTFDDWRSGSDKLRPA